MTENIFHKLAKKIKTDTSTLDQRRSQRKDQRNINSMLQDLKEHGYDDNALKIIRAYLHLARTTSGAKGAAWVGPETNSLYQTLINNKIYNNSELAFISKASTSNRIDFKDLQLLSGLENEQQMRYVYYAIIKRIPIDILYDNDEPLSEEDMIKAIEDHVSKNKTNISGRPENVKILRKAQQQGYKIQGIKDLVDDISSEALADVLYSQAIGLGTDNTDTLIQLIRQNISDRSVRDKRKEFEEEKYKQSTDTPDLETLLNTSINDIEEESKRNRE